MSAFLVGADSLLALDDHVFSALGAGLFRRSVPAHELAIGISETAVILSALSGYLDHNLVAAGWTIDTGLLVIGLGILTLGITGACKELAGRTVLDDELSSALFAYLVGFLFPDLNLLEFFIRLVDGFLKIGIEIPDDGLPLNIAFFNTVEKSLDIGGELGIDYRRECLAHKIVHRMSDIGDIQVLLFLGHIASLDECCDGRSIGTGTSDALLFESSYKGAFGVMSGRLGKVLSGIEVIQSKNRLLAYCGIKAFFILGIVSLDIYLPVTFEGKPA